MELSNSTDYHQIAKYFWDKRDIRVDDWPLMNSPWPTVGLIVIYTCVSLFIGPWFMKHRQPYNIIKFILFYNFCMIIYNGYVVYQLWTLAWGNDYSWTCQPLDRSTSPKSLKIASTIWLYFVCKYLDWFDTLFFILRKKFDHVTGVHVYHHMIMPSIAWFGARFMPGGQGSFFGLVNCAVHVVMHFYYYIAALGPKYRKYLWWKKYLTLLQLVQFAIVVINALIAIWNNTCGIDLPIEWGYYFLVQLIIFIYLFIKFYRNNYGSKPVQETSHATSNGINDKNKYDLNKNKAA